jgi:chromosome segregation ATPase
MTNLVDALEQDLPRERVQQVRRELFQSEQHPNNEVFGYSDDFILLVSSLTVQLEQNKEDLEESQTLLHLIMGKMDELQSEFDQTKKELERVHTQLEKTQAELDISQVHAHQILTEKEWLQSKYHALKQTAQQLQKELEQR